MLGSSFNNIILQARRVIGPGHNIMYADLKRWPTEEEKLEARVVLGRLALATKEDK